MENATKALLIAASVLIVILLITFGVGIFNNSTEQVGEAGNLNELQIQKFNEKFTKYKGSNVSGSYINTMLKTVFNHNLSQKDDSTTVEVYYLGDDYTLGGEGTIIQASTNQLQSPPKVPINKKYEVRIQIDENTHLVKLIQFYAHGDTIPPE